MYYILPVVTPTFIASADKSLEDCIGLEFVYSSNTDPDDGEYSIYYSSTSGNLSFVKKGNLGDMSKSVASNLLNQDDRCKDYISSLRAGLFPFNPFPSDNSLAFREDSNFFSAGKLGNLLNTRVIANNYHTVSGNTNKYTTTVVYEYELLHLEFSMTRYIIPRSNYWELYESDFSITPSNFKHATDCCITACCNPQNYVLKG